MLIILFFLLLTASVSWRWMSSPGLECFKAVVFINWFCISAGGAGTFSSVITEEKEEKTLSSIATLPISPPTLAYQKVAGCLIALVPAFFYFFLGVLLASQSFAEVFIRIAGDADGWFSILHVPFFLHLVVFLSLILRRGILAMLVALAALFIGEMSFFQIVFAFLFFRPGMGSGEAFTFVFSVGLSF